MNPPHFYSPAMRGFFMLNECVCFICVVPPVSCPVAGLDYDKEDFLYNNQTTTINNENNALSYTEEGGETWKITNPF